MEDLIRRATVLSVVRGCGFGTLVIVTTMVGAAGNAAMVVRTGGFGMLLMALILILKAFRADQVPFKATEVWIMLDKDQRPPEAIAGRLIARERRAIMLKYAYFSSIIAGALLGVDALVMILSRA